MRPEEKNVLDAIVQKYGGEYTEGEDPPDAYLNLRGKTIAVEVSRLVEHVNEDGELVSRLTHDGPAVGLADKLDRDISSQIPDGRYVVLIIPAPIRNYRKTSNKLKVELVKFSQGELGSFNMEIEGNRFDINVYEGVRETGKKVIGVIVNRYSDANIGVNTRYALADRIMAKSKKCKLKPNMDEYWLALLNSYWLASEDTYRCAFKDIDIQHSFQKIIIVDEHSRVYELSK